MNTREYFAVTWPKEIELTVNAFSMLPPGQLDYRPHPLTRSAGEIVEHVIAQPHDMEQAFREGKIEHRRKLPFDRLDAAVAAYTAQCEKVMELIRQASDADWDGKLIPFIVRGRQAREGVIRDMCYTFMFDMIHHRGQLSTYFRPMGARNPYIYGPTAEMIAEMRAAKQQDEQDGKGKN